ncbi:uncharacterized protein LOC144879463 [Branchiostoma floridae x Branchiostoma japonicum]
MKTTIMMKVWAILLLVVLERTAEAAPAAHRVARSEEDSTTSTYDARMARMRFNCSPPWSRQCQTSDSIIFKRSLKEQDLLAAEAVSSDSTNGTAAISSDSTSGAAELEGNGQQDSTQKLLRRSTGSVRGRMSVRKILSFLRLHKNPRYGVL